MKNLFLLALALAGVAAAQDAKTVIANASKAMGLDGVNSLYYDGVAENGNLGQNNNSNQPWPMAGANDYVRAIDFTQPASRATWKNYAVPVTGGLATLTDGQQNITPQSPWAQAVEIYLTPWGFLKGAAASRATVKPGLLGGKAYKVVTYSPSAKSPGGAPYRLVGYISPQGTVDKVQTWVENPVFGDMLVEAEYTQWREGADGLKYPSQMVQSRGGWPTFKAYVLGVHGNPPNLQALMTPPPPPRPANPPPAAPVQPAQSVVSEKLADGVYRINGAYNAVAIEFADQIVLFEPGPQNEARAQAVIAEAKRLIPNKPIRFGVISHHHFDHTGGLEAAVAEGITIVTPAVNKAFLTKALSAPRTLTGDALAKSRKKPVIEGFAGDKRVFQDANHSLEIHVIKGLPHADGLVVGYLPKEKILIYADMFNLPTPINSVPNPPVVGTGVFMDNIDRLGLQPERVMSIHNLNPDRLTTIAEIKASLGRK